MKAVGLCLLCKNVGPLRNSHYLPAALYARKKEPFEFQTHSGKALTRTQIQQFLLCGRCEKLFNDNGENAVLQAIRPKDLRNFVLGGQLKLALPRDGYSSCPRYDARDFGLDTDKFAYFAMSVLWRGMVTTWTMFDGNETTKLPVLGPQDEDIRLYLLGMAPFPPNVSVIVIVCGDEVSRKTMFFPAAFVEVGCLNVGFTLRGIHFRVMMGQIPQFYRTNCCLSSHRPIFYGDAAERTQQGYATIAALRERAPWLDEAD